MRKAFSLTILVAIIVLLAFPAGAAYAAAAGSKPVVAVLPVLDNSGQRSGRYAAQTIEDKLVGKFSDGRYNVLYGQVLLDGLKNQGIDDVRTADTASVQAALGRMRVDYSIRTELMYVSLQQKVSLPTVLLFVKTWNATVPLFINVMDVNQGVALYDSTMIETGKHEAVIGFANQTSAVKNALDKILPRIDREVNLPE
ncbi:MAG: hypothetical protein P4N41_07510 [Negativicutes bacterium]|nr:hypothetical protein [Negativicutes bacterium]